MKINIPNVPIAREGHTFRDLCAKRHTWSFTLLESSCQQSTHHSAVCYCRVSGLTLSRWTHCGRGEKATTEIYHRGELHRMGPSSQAGVEPHPVTMVAGQNNGWLSITSESTQATRSSVYSLEVREMAELVG